MRPSTVKRRRAWWLAGLWGLTVTGGGPALADNPPVTATIDASKSNFSAAPTAISPLIYGDNGDTYSDYDSTANFPTTTRTTTAKIPILRLGGDLFSTYNWQIDAQNHDFSNYFESISCANGTTTAGTVTTNGQLIDSFYKFCQSTGASPMVTVQMFPYLANLAYNRNELFSFPVSDITNGELIDGTFFNQSGFPNQTSDDTSAGSSYTGNVAAGSGYDGNTGNPLSVTPNSNFPTSITYIPYVPNSATIQQNFLTHLTATYGTAGNGGFAYYILDNEPGDWCDTHFDCYPTGVHTAQYLSLFGTYAQMVKSTDPNALVIAPEDTAWYTYFYSGYDNQTGNGTDYSDPAGQNGTSYYPYLLSQIQTQSTTAGKRLLDYLSFHYYAQSGDVYSDDDSTATDNLRNQSTRELWDPDYITPAVPNPIQGNGSYAPMVIPLMQGWIQSGYPGTKLALTEYSFGDDQAINGATTEADVLGILGAYGVDLATRFGDQSYTADPTLSFADKAIQMYTNYDGNGSHFGNSSVSDSVPDTEPTPQTTYTGRDNFASYAALRSSDGALTVMVINKVLGGSTPVTLAWSNFSAGSNAQVWQLTSSGAITQLTNVAVAANSLTATVPAQSITLYVIPAQTAAAQTINFPAIANQLYPDPDVALGATATSGLTVTYTVLSGPAIVTGSTLTLTGTGAVTVQASQAGNANYQAAANVSRSFTVTASPDLTFSQWEGQAGFFTVPQLLNPLTSGPTATPEGDGVPNLLKYLYNIDPARPMTAADRTALPVLGKTMIAGTQYLTLTYRQYALKTGITLSVQTSSNLQTWSTVTTATPAQTGTDTNTGDPIMQVQVAETGTRQYMRLNVTMP